VICCLLATRIQDSEPASTQHLTIKHLLQLGEIRDPYLLIGLITIWTKNPANFLPSGLYCLKEAKNSIKSITNMN
jgi:hypothetical protein